jgi:dTMP kinase
LGRGLFITFEGPEGSGKTTQVEMLGEALASRQPAVVREPGGTDLGERMRELLLFGHLELDAEAEMYLFMSARRQLIAEVIAPQLAAGRIVIADRYHDSTLAYQGGGRGLASYWPATFPRPDITFLLALPVENGRARQLSAGKAADRVERESLEFHRRVAAEYERLANIEPARFVRLDANESKGRLHSTVMDRVNLAADVMNRDG